MSNQKINLLCADCNDNKCDGTECDLPDGYVRSMVFGVRSQPRQEKKEEIVKEKKEEIVEGTNEDMDSIDCCERCGYIGARINDMNKTRTPVWNDENKCNGCGKTMSGIYEKKGGCNYCGDVSRRLDMSRLKTFGIFLLGEESLQKITVEDYKKYCEGYCCHYIGALVVYDMGDKARERFWDEVNDFKKKYNIQDLLLDNYGARQVLLLYTLRETPEQRTERIIKEDEDKQKEDELKQLPERRLKRIAVIEKHKAILDASIVGKQKGIRFRKYFHSYVNAVAQRVFETEEEEYAYVGKAGRLRYTDIEEQMKAYKKNDPMLQVIGEIMTEFGCFDY